MTQVYDGGRPGGASPIPASQARRVKSASPGHLPQTITVPGRPWGLNRERSAHWTQHRTATRSVREQAFWRAKASHLRPMSSVHIVVTCGMAAPLLDTGSNLPTVKAMIDGLVDAGVLRNDTPDIVRSLVFLAPEKVKRGAVQWTTLTLHPVADTGPVTAVV